MLFMFIFETLYYILNVIQLCCHEKSWLSLECCLPCNVILQVKSLFSFPALSDTGFLEEMHNIDMMSNLCSTSYFVKVGVNKASNLQKLSETTQNLL